MPTLSAERIRVYVNRQYEVGKRHAVAIAARLDLGPVRQMLDIAGGSGIYSITFAQRQPTLLATVFELPPMVLFIQAIIARYDMQERVMVSAGNYCLDDFAAVNDLVLLSNSLQTEGVTICRMVLGKVFKALVPGGQLVIHGVMPNPDRVTPPQAALFQVQMPLSFPEGDAHPAEEICSWAAEVGFEAKSANIAPARARSTLLAARPAQESYRQRRRVVDIVTT